MILLYGNGGSRTRFSKNAITLGVYQGFRYPNKDLTTVLTTITKIYGDKRF